MKEKKSQVTPSPSPLREKIALWEGRKDGNLVKGAKGRSTGHAGRLFLNSLGKASKQGLNGERSDGTAEDEINAPSFVRRASYREERSDGRIPPPTTKMSNRQEVSSEGSSVRAFSRDKTDEVRSSFRRKNFTRQEVSSDTKPPSERNSVKVSRFISSSSTKKNSNQQEGSSDSKASSAGRLPVASKFISKLEPKKLFKSNKSSRVEIPDDHKEQDTSDTSYEVCKTEHQSISLENNNMSIKLETQNDSEKRGSTPDSSENIINSLVDPTVAEEDIREELISQEVVIADDSKTPELLPDPEEPLSPVAPKFIVFEGPTPPDTFESISQSSLQKSQNHIDLDISAPFQELHTSTYCVPVQELDTFDDYRSSIPSQEGSTHKDHNSQLHIQEVSLQEESTVKEQNSPAPSQEDYNSSNVLQDESTPEDYNSVSSPELLISINPDSSIQLQQTQSPVDLNFQTPFQEPQTFVDCKSSLLFEGSSSSSEFQEQTISENICPPVTSEEPHFPENFRSCSPLQEMCISDDFSSLTSFQERNTPTDYNSPVSFQDPCTPMDSNSPVQFQELYTPIDSPTSLQELDTPDESRLINNMEESNIRKGSSNSPIPNQNCAVNNCIPLAQVEGVHLSKDPISQLPSQDNLSPLPQDYDSQACYEYPELHLENQNIPVPIQFQGTSELSLSPETTSHVIPNQEQLSESPSSKEESSFNEIPKENEEETMLPPSSGEDHTQYRPPSPQEQTQENNSLTSSPTEEENGYHTKHQNGDVFEHLPIEDDFPWRHQSFLNEDLCTYLENQTLKLELELKDEKIASLTRELSDLNFTGKTEEEVALLKKTKHDLELKVKDQEEELDDLAGQVQMLEAARVRLEMSIEQMRKENRRELSQRDEEMEEVRVSAQKKIKALEAQLESEHDERTALVREKHDLERRLVDAHSRSFTSVDEEAFHRVKKELKKTKALLKDTQTMLEKTQSEGSNKLLLRQLKTQLEDAEFAKNAAIKARQSTEADFTELQNQIEEALRAKKDTEDKLARITKEKAEVQTQLEESEEEVAEVMKKYKATVSQLSVDQVNISEQAQLIADLEHDKQVLQDKLTELSSKVEVLEGETANIHTQRRLQMKIKELESKHDLELTTRQRLESQITRLKDQVERVSSECDAIRMKEMQAVDHGKKVSRQLREAKEDSSSLQQKLTDAISRKQEVEKQYELAESEIMTLKSDLKLAFKRIEDLQQALQGDLSDSDTELSESGGSESDLSLTSFLTASASTSHSSERVTSTVTATAAPAVPANTEPVFQETSLTGNDSDDSKHDSTSLDLRIRDALVSGSSLMAAIREEDGKESYA